MTTAIDPFLKESAVFDAHETHAIAVAFDEICKMMNLPLEAKDERETIAVRVIDFARAGELDPYTICKRILREARASA